MKKNLALRIVLSTVILVVLGTLWGIYNSYYPAIAGQSAVEQLEDSAVSYALSKTAINLYHALRGLNGVVIGSLFLLWVKPTMEFLKKRKEMALLLVFVGLAMSTSACIKPYKEVILVEIEPNQTAFVVPLAGETSGQEQFASVDYLADKQVATKRIEIDPVWHQTGHLATRGEWIPSAKVITVDRSPVTREWTQRAEKGSTDQDDAFEMETMESIDFSYGGVLSALITEEDAATFLYRYAGRDLATIIDTDIRAFMQGELADAFGDLHIKGAQESKGEIFSVVCKDTIEKFTDFGITITACGASGGLIYHDPKIQEAITANFETQQEQIRAQAALDAQATKNLRIISEAEALAEAEIIKGQAQAEVIRLQGEAIANNPMIVNYEIAIRGTGEVPNTFLYAGGDTSQLPFAFFLSPEEEMQMTVPTE